MNHTNRAFTLIEMLIVIAIITVLAALIFPVLRSSKRRGKEAVTISNLRQCAQALLIYSEDYGGERFVPSTQITADLALKTAPTCDPADYWRSGCSDQVGSPMVGSYGYTRLLWPGPPGQSGWDDYLTSDGSHYLMTCIFYASPKYPRFQGDQPHYSTLCKPLSTCNYPDRFWRVRMDTSVQLTTFNPQRADGSFWLITWSSVMFHK